MAAPTLSRKPIASLDKHPADPRTHVDWALLVAVAALAAFGLLAIYTARYTGRALAGLDVYYFVKRQGLALIAGGMAMLVVMLIDYRKLRDFAWVFFAGTSALLALVLAVANAKNGIDAWFDIGPFQLQPSEFAKVTLVLMLASFIASDRVTGLPFNKFVGALLITAIPGALVMLQPDLGTASVLAAITMGILLVAGAKPRHIALVTIMAAISVTVVVSTGTLAKYQTDRLTYFINQTPTKENKDLILQVRNSKIAIAQGRLSGQGYLEGPMTNGGYVPEQHTDFVFSAVAEQFGLLGAGALLLLYAFIALRFWRIALMSKDTLGTLICAGALAMLVWHVFENVGMTMGLTPVTGIPLPLVSYGGSSTVAFLTLVGLVENVHMRRYA